MRPAGVLLLFAFGSLAIACAGTPGGFDIEKVQANWVAECEEIWDSALEQDMCDSAAFDKMAANGLTLIVPTSYERTLAERAAELCDIVAVYHYDRNTGYDDLGYKAVNVLDATGAEAARCATRY